MDAEDFSTQGLGDVPEVVKPSTCTSMSVVGMKRPERPRCAMPSTRRASIDEAVESLNLALNS